MLEHAAGVGLKKMTSKTFNSPRWQHFSMKFLSIFFNSYLGFFDIIGLSHVQKRTMIAAFAALLKESYQKTSSQHITE